MAKWRPMTDNQKRQMKMQVKHRVNQIGFVPRARRRMSRNKEERGNGS